VTRLLVTWLLNAVSLTLIARLVPGIQIEGFGIALVAALVFGLVNATLGFVLRVLTFPFAILTLGLFVFVVNALMLKVAAALVPGFRVSGCIPALIGAVLLSLLNMAFRYVLPF
jgi:putative membrane protein